MTIQTTSNKAIVQGNNSTTVFSFNFVYGSASYMEVYFTDINGVTQLLDPSVYTLSLNAPAGGIWGVGGTVTYPLMGPAIQTGEYLTILRELPEVQSTTVSNQGAAYPNVLEAMSDRLTMICQQLTELFSRTITGPVTDLVPFDFLPPASERILTLLGFDNTGQIKLYPLDVSNLINLPYDLVQFYPGTPTNGMLMSNLVMLRKVKFTQNFPGGYAKATLAATGQTILIIKKNGVQVGTITFAASGTTGVLASTGDINVVPGDILSIYNAATADATLSNISVSFTGVQL